MSLKTFVKVTNISNLSDARYCAGMGVDLLGFNIDPNSEKCVSPELFNEITGWVSGIQTVGEVGKAVVAEAIPELLSTYKVDYLQISDLRLLATSSSISTRLIFKVEIVSEADWIGLPSLFERIKGQVEMIIVETSNQSLFEDLTQQIENLSAQFDIKILKAFELSESSAAELNSDVFYGIELSGSQEERPGFNDYGDLMDILEVLEED